MASVCVIQPCCVDDEFIYGATTLTFIMSGNRPHEQLHWLVLELVKQNIIVFATSPVDNTTLTGYQSAHIDAIQIIKDENERIDCRLV